MTNFNANFGATRCSLIIDFDKVYESNSLQKFQSIQIKLRRDLPKAVDCRITERDLLTLPLHKRERAWEVEGKENLAYL